MAVHNIPLFVPSESWMEHKYWRCSLFDFSWVWIYSDSFKNVYIIQYICGAYHFKDCALHSLLKQFILIWFLRKGYRTFFSLSFLCQDKITIILLFPSSLISSTDHDMSRLQMEMHPLIMEPLVLHHPQLTTHPSSTNDRAHSTPN